MPIGHVVHLYVETGKQELPSAPHKNVADRPCCCMYFVGKLHCMLGE